MKHRLPFFLLTSIVMIAGCSTQRTVEEHHHYEADTMAVSQQVDRQLASWHEEMTQFFTQRMDEYRNELSSHENQKETVSELITETTDSLGRKVRQEQRTISRDITRELQQQESRLSQEYETRLHAVVDSLNDSYRQRYESMAARVARLDSTLATVQRGSAALSKPWYQRWWAKILWFLIGVSIACFCIRILLSRNQDRK